MLADCQEPLLNTKSAAKFLHISWRTLEGLRASGRGPKFVKFDGRIVRYRPSDLKEWIESRIRVSTTENTLPLGAA